MPSETARQFIADENLDSEICIAMAAEYDLISVTEIMRGAADSAILERAKSERRILVTQDKDFGALAFFLLQAHSGVILLRAPELSAETRGALLLSTIARHENELMYAFTVIDAGRIRIRPGRK